MKKFLYAFSALIVIGLGIWLLSAAPKIPPAQDSASASGSRAAGFSLATTTVKIAHNDSLATVDIEYPELSLSGISDGIVSKINDDIASGTLAFEKDFFTQVQDAQSGLAGLPREVPRDSELYRRYQVFGSAEFGTVSILYSDERAFPGDAHPMNAFSSAIYDTKTGAAIPEASIVSPGKIPDLYRILIEDLKGSYPEIDTANGAYNLTIDRLPQFTHFIVEDSGLHAYIDQDSILSHVDGPANTLIPWKSLRQVISAQFRK